MKIKVILASSSQELVRSQLANRQKALAPGTEITIVAPGKCPPSTEGEVDEILAAPQILSEVIKAKEEGFNAVTIDCTLEPGLRAAKQVSSIPVVGAGGGSSFSCSNPRRAFFHPGTAAIKLAEVLATTGWTPAQLMRKKKE